MKRSAFPQAFLRIVVVLPFFLHVLSLGDAIAVVKVLSRPGTCRAVHVMVAKSALFAVLFRDLPAPFFF